MTGSPISRPTRREAELSEISDKKVEIVLHVAIWQGESPKVAQQKGLFQA